MGNCRKVTKLAYPTISTRMRNNIYCFFYFSCIRLAQCTNIIFIIIFHLVILDNLAREPAPVLLKSDLSNQSHYFVCVVCVLLYRNLKLNLTNCLLD